MNGILNAGAVNSELLQAKNKLSSSFSKEALLLG